MSITETPCSLFAMTAENDDSHIKGYIGKSFIQDMTRLKGRTCEINSKSSCKMFFLRVSSVRNDFPRYFRRHMKYIMRARQ